MSTVEQADAVVIGSGFGGAITAYHLAAAGAKVVVLERGPDMTGADLSTQLPQLRFLEIVDAVIGDGVTVLAGN
jgi:choline dehydrogenase-like flavoprotein